MELPVFCDSCAWTVLHAFQETEFTKIPSIQDDGITAPLHRCRAGCLEEWQTKQITRRSWCDSKKIAHSSFWLLLERGSAGKFKVEPGFGLGILCDTNQERGFLFEHSLTNYVCGSQVSCHCHFPYPIQYNSSSRFGKISKTRGIRELLWKLTRLRWRIMI